MKVKSFLLLILFPLQVWGAQLARVLEDQTIIYQSPDRSSSQLSQLSIGNEVIVSSKMIKTSEEEYWYKIKMGEGQFGFVLAKNLRTFQTSRELYEAGIQISPAQDVEGSSISYWNILLRGMGVFGKELTYSSNEIGGEGELTIGISPYSRGSSHRMFSLGIAYLYFKYDQALLASGIIRAFTRSSIEPELRLRVGQSLVNQTLVGGFNLGLSYAFSSPRSTHFSAFFEIGSLLGGTPGAPLYVWGATGLGIYF